MTSPRLGGLIEWGFDVTVIAALRESEASVLLAADRGGSESSGKGLGIFRVKTECKLRSHATAPLAWATSGDPTVGDEFDAWLRNTAWPPAANDLSFVYEVRERLARLNGRQRDLARAARVEPAEVDNRIIDALLVYWLDGTEIVEFGNDGGASRYTRQGFHAIGAGKGLAYGAHRALAGHIHVNPVSSLQAIVSVPCEFEPECGLPIDIWRVGETGHQEIEWKS